MPQVTLTVNGKQHTVEVEGRTLLVELLREKLGLTGTHVGCDTSQCGACVVHVDGVSAKSCTMLALQADGTNVLTIEGLAAADGTLHPMQEMFREHHALQCGFCTPGMVMSAVDLVNSHPEGLTEKQIREGLEGNLCRCTGYHNIVKAIAAAWPLMHAEGGGRGITTSHRETSMPFEGIGAAVRRKEDARFLSGRGNYTDDINRPGQLHAFVRRSDRPHAKISRYRHAAAAKAPGVVAVFTGADMAADNVGGLPCGWQIHSKDGSPMAEPPHPVLAVGQGAPCRRSGCRGDGRDQAGGKGRRRADRHRLPGTAGGCVNAGCNRARGTAGARRCARQHLLRLAYRRQGGGRCSLRQGRQGGEARAHQQPTDPECDGAARCDRRFRLRQRRLHALHHQPEPARHPAADGRLRAAHPGEQAARGGA